MNCLLQNYTKPVRTPLLLLVYNRPSHTKQAIEAILKENPGQVFIAGDGPKPHNSADSEKVGQVWEIVSNAKWNCPVSVLKNDKNKGCYLSVSQALDWFFNRVNYGLVIEDDVVIAKHSLDYFEHMMQVSAHDSRVGGVSIFNSVPTSYLSEPNTPYRLSVYTSSQGWGTWSNRWVHYRRSFNDWREWLPPEKLGELGDKRFVRYWSSFFDGQVENFLPSWDFLWLATNWSMGWKTLASNINMTLNIGFDKEATFSHTQPLWYPRATYSDKVRRVLNSNLDVDLNVDKLADKWISNNVMGISVSKAIKRNLVKRFPKTYSRYYNLRLRHMPQL